MPVDEHNKRTPIMPPASGLYVKLVRRLNQIQISDLNLSGSFMVPHNRVARITCRSMQGRTAWLYPKLLACAVNSLLYT